MTYLSFPRQHARTQRFTLGVPRGFVVAPQDAAGAGRVVFVRARTGSGSSADGAEHLLWVLDLPGGGADGADGAVPAAGERVVADPVALLGGADEELPPAERARRERSREGSAGIVAFAVDEAVATAAFALSGRLFTAELTPGAGGARELAVPGPVVDPRPAPVAGRPLGRVHRAGGAARRGSHRIG